MRIYFSGIGGVGIGPLAEIAIDAGYEVVGSDIKPSLITKELKRRSVTVHYSQDGSSLEAEHGSQPIDLFIHTSAIKDGHPELTRAHELGIKTGKRDELIAEIIKQHDLRLIAVAGTHGKTTTSGLMVWAMQQLGVPISYSVGTTLTFGPSGKFDPASRYFVYECDEFDRNFLHFWPEISLIVALDYDHPDVYPTLKSYQDAFVEFMEQSNMSLLWEKDLRFLAHPDIPASYEAYDDLMELDHITLAGRHNRQNAYLVQRALARLEELRNVGEQQLVDAINSFPGTDRRFEKLVDGLYTDYGHMPAEVSATLQMAKERSQRVVLVYQPLQNIRQHEVRDQYNDDLFQHADEIYWVPTTLIREFQDLPILTPIELSQNIHNIPVHDADVNDELWTNMTREREQGSLVIMMSGGSLDGWARDKVAKS